MTSNNDEALNFYGYSSYEQLEQALLEKGYGLDDVSVRIESMRQDYEQQKHDALERVVHKKEIRTNLPRNFHTFSMIMVVAIMAKGHFTNGGHYIVLRGMTSDGKISVADCGSKARNKAWDFNIVYNEARKGFGWK